MNLSMDPLKPTHFPRLAAAVMTALAWAPALSAQTDPGPLGAAPAAPDLDASLVVVSAAEDAIALLDPDTGERRAFFRVGVGPTAAAVSSDGRTAVVTHRGRALSGNSICVIDLHAASIVRTIPLTTTTVRADGTSVIRSYHRPDDVLFFPGEARVLVSCASEGALLQVDLLQKKVIGVVELGGVGADDIVLDHAGKHAYVTDRAAGKVHIVRLESMTVARSLDAGGGTTGIAIHPTRNEVWATNTHTNTISIIDCDKLEERLEFPCGAMPVDLAFTPDGKHALVVNHQEGNVSIIDSRSLRVRALVKIPRVSSEQAAARPVAEPVAFGRSSLPTAVAVEPSGDRAWITAERSDLVHEVDLASWKITATHQGPGAPAHVTWSALTPEAITSPIVPIAPSESSAGVSTDPWERSFPGGGLPAPPADIER